MPKIYPIIRRITTIISGGGDEVTSEKITYDLPEVAPTPSDSNAIATVVSETAPTPTEDAGAGLLFTADETAPTPVNEVLITVDNTADETAPTPVDDNSAVVIAPEENPPEPTELAHLETSVLTEVAPTPTENATLIPIVNETAPTPTDELNLQIKTDETAPTPSELAYLEASVLTEVAPTPTEETPLTFNIILQETPDTPTDLNALVAAALESATVPTDTNTIDLNIIYLYPDTTVTNTNWTNPANMIDKNTGTAATCAATSSGAIPGLTSNTTNGTLVDSTPNFAADITNFTITDVDLFINHQCTLTAGTALLNQAHAMSYEYSLNDGASWTVIHNDTTFPSNNHTDSVDITSAVGGDWTKINQIRFRATGSVTSGTGTASNVTVTEAWFYARVQIRATRTY